MAAALGAQLTGWQSAALDVAGELDVDRHGVPTGRMAYPVVVWIVPRRAGKSFATLVRLLSRATSAPHRRCWYTLHRREVGGALWRDEWFPMVEGSKLAAAITTRRSNGSETMTVRRWGSTVRLIAPDGQALRSQNADTVAVDEALRFTETEGDRLEAAARPAFLRRPLRQLWLVSSAGKTVAASPWLARYRDLGRDAVEAGARDQVCYLEYSAPEGAPWDHPDTWRAGHPAVADGTIPVDALAADLATMDPEDFQSEYLGWWQAPAGRAVDLAGWSRCADPAAVLPGAGWWIAADATPDRTAGAVTIAAPAGDRVHVEVVRAEPGAAWLAGAVAQLATAQPGARVRLDAYGPAGNLLAELQPRLRDRLEVAGTADVARACAQLHDLVAAGRLRHRAQPELDAAAAGAVARRHGDAWLWDRRATAPALLAATLAVDGAARPAPAGKPVIAVGR